MSDFDLFSEADASAPDPELHKQALRHAEEHHKQRLRHHEERHKQHQRHREEAHKQNMSIARSAGGFYYPTPPEPDADDQPSAPVAPAPAGG